MMELVAAYVVVGVSLVVYTARLLTRQMVLERQAAELDDCDTSIKPQLTNGTRRPAA